MLDPKPRHGNRQTKAARPGAPGVHEEHAVTLLDERMMRVAADDGRDAGEGAVAVELLPVVDHEDPRPGELDGGPHGERHRPDAAVVVAADGGQRRDLPQCLEHLGRADVAGVEDVSNALERGERLGPDEAVSVGDHPDVTPIA